MTQKTVDRTDPQHPKKMDGWFSWRHENRTAHEDARARYAAQHGKAARRRKAAERAARSVPCKHGLHGVTAHDNGICSTCRMRPQVAA